MRDAVNLPEGPLADQGFDAIFVEKDFTGLKGHILLPFSDT